MKLEVKQRIICCLVAATLFLLGMCLDTIEADSYSAFDKSTHTDASIGSVSYLLEEVDSCTTDVLGNTKSASVHSDSIRNVAKRQTRIIQFSVIVGAILQYLLYFHSTVCGECYRIIHSDTVAVNYIHCKDGEK